MMFVGSQRGNIQDKVWKSPKHINSPLLLGKQSQPKANPYHTE